MRATLLRILQQQSNDRQQNLQDAEQLYKAAREIRLNLEGNEGSSLEGLDHAIEAETKAVAGVLSAQKALGISEPLWICGRKF